MTLSLTSVKKYFFSKQLNECEQYLSTIQHEPVYEKALAFYEKEKNRLIAITKHEKFLTKTGCLYIAGVDEVGRGPLAGPIVSGSVILPKDYYLFGLDDSKKLSPEKREILFNKILEDCIAASIHTISNKGIDSIGIAKADKLTMKVAVEKLEIQADHVLSDAFTIDDLNINQTAIIKGDANSITIAAASIIAKVTRDRIMEEYDKIYPGYAFSSNKGYGTKEHISAIEQIGICPIHRKSFIRNISFV